MTSAERRQQSARRSRMKVLLLLFDETQPIPLALLRLEHARLPRISQAAHAQLQSEAQGWLSEKVCLPTSCSAMFFGKAQRQLGRRCNTASLGRSSKALGTHESTPRGWSRQVKTSLIGCSAQTALGSHPASSSCSRGIESSCSFTQRIPAEPALLPAPQGQIRPTAMTGKERQRDSSDCRWLHATRG